MAQSQQKFAVFVQFYGWYKQVSGNSNKTTEGLCDYQLTLKKFSRLSD